MQLHYLPQLSEDQKVDFYFHSTIKLLKPKMSGVGLLFLLYFRVFKYKSFLIVLNFIIEAAAKCAISLLMSNLIVSTFSGDYTSMITIASVLSLAMLIGVITKHYA